MAQGNDMTTEFQTDSSVSKTTVDSINIGNRLKAKRLELEFDERYVATELKIPIDQVRALEANNFTYFRSVTFARGFLKSYCRLLEIDPSEMLSAFDSAREDVEPTIKPVDKVNKQTNFGDPIVILISVVIVAVLIFLVFWWPAQTSNDVAVNDANSEVSETASPAKVDKDELASVGSNESASNTENSAVVADESSNSQSLNNDEKAEETNENGGVVTGLSAETMAILEEAGVKPEDVIRATAEVPAENASIPKLPSYTDEVEIAFDADCWAEVRDSTGKILFSGVKTANSTLSLTGKAPYRVVLGYAKGVSFLKYKGEEFDFSSFTRKDLARFELK